MALVPSPEKEKPLNRIGYWRHCCLLAPHIVIPTIAAALVLVGAGTPWVARAHRVINLPSAQSKAGDRIVARSPCSCRRLIPMWPITRPPVPH